jgi:hypothetical protein
MKKKNSLRFFFNISFFTSFLAHAHKDDYVTNWAQNLLIETLSISYLDKPHEIDITRKKYSHAAWEPMNSFFHKEIKIIEEHKLILHPKPLTEPTIIRTEECISIHCWRVNQSFNIPELHMNIAFSLLIVSAMPVINSPFLVQSVDMVVRNY